MTILGVLVLLLVYGSAVEPRLILDVEEEVAPIPGLPPEWEGEEVAVLADFQIGIWWANRGMMERAVREAIRRRPAVVLLAGDFIYQPDDTPADLVEDVVEVLRPLAASGIPTYAVLGNHDWGLEVPKDSNPNVEAMRLTREALTALGIPVLRNQAIPLARPGGGAGTGVPLYLVGIGSEYANEAEPLDALREVPQGAPRVVFMHNPDSFREIPAGAAPLAVAGHTHGGQIRVPGLPEWSWMALVQGGEVTADGWIDDYGEPGNRLYVNRGIGFSYVPIRLFCPPELTLFTLRRAP